MFYDEIEADVIEALRIEAGAAGDWELVEAIDRAEGGDTAAQEIVVEALEAAAMDDDSDDY